MQLLDSNEIKNLISQNVVRFITPHISLLSNENFLGGAMTISQMMHISERSLLKVLLNTAVEVLIGRTNTVFERNRHIGWNDD